MGGNDKLESISSYYALPISTDGQPSEYGSKGGFFWAQQYLELLIEQENQIITARNDCQSRN